MKKILIAMLSLTMGLFSVNVAYAAAPASHDGIEIIMATFGAEHERDRCDAKSLVSKACDKKQSCHIPAMLEMCGPAKSMVPRKLTVVYSCRNDGNTVVAAENEIARLECRP